MSHLKETNLSWNRHRVFAWRLAFKSFKCCLIFLVHGFLPSVLVHSGSDEIHKLDQELS